MKKADRQKLYAKYGGRCAYCGCELVKGWHVDEIEPVRRSWKYKKDEMGQLIYNNKGNPIKIHYMEHPERLHIDNQNPACASCNINKHSNTLEQFRENIAGYLKSLNERMVQYKMVKKYGLVVETEKPVVFYFETLESLHSSVETL